MAFCPAFNFPGGILSGWQSAGVAFFPVALCLWHFVLWNFVPWHFVTWRAVSTVKTSSRFVTVSWAVNTRLAITSDIESTSLLCWRSGQRETSMTHVFTSLLILQVLKCAPGMKQACAGFYITSISYSSYRYSSYRVSPICLFLAEI